MSEEAEVGLFCGILGIVLGMVLMCIIQMTTQSDTYTLQDIHTAYTLGQADAILGKDPLKGIERIDGVFSVKGK